MSSWQMTHKMIGNKVAKNTQSRISTLLPNPTRYALGGILPTNSILHEGGGLSNLLQYCIGGEKSLGIPNLYYLMNGRPLIFSLVAYFLQQKWHFFFSLFPCCMLIAGKRGQWGFLSPLCPMLLQLAGTVDVYLFYATLCNQFFEVLLPFIKTRGVLLCYPSHNLIWLN